MTAETHTTDGGAGSPDQRVRAVLAASAVTAVFQPIVCLQTGEISGFEALTRVSASTGYAGPLGLFEDAAAAGLLWELEELTRARIIQTAGELPPGTLLFFNTSPAVMADARYPASLQRLLREADGALPSRLVLEITEASSDQVVEGLADRVRELRALGFQVAIDDAGAGASGLNRFMLLRPQWLKLDRELIRGIHLDRLKHNLVRFLVHFATLSGVQVIAEGIELRDELGVLIDLGVRFGQGYALGKPMPAYQLIDPDMREWIRQRSAESQNARGRDLHSVTVSQLAKWAESVQASTSICSAAGDLLRDANQPGFIVVDGRRFVGWCSRERVLRAAGTRAADKAIAEITPPSVSTLLPTATLADALELLSIRDEDELSNPVVIADRDRIAGIVSVRALLGAAAGHSASSANRVDPLTGLPGRVAADQHLHRLIAAQRGLVGGAGGQAAGQGGSSGVVAGGGGLDGHTDALFVDIQLFRDYNGAFGYELGDQLISDLAQLLRAELIDRPALATVPEPFIAHLGMDRFLVTADTGSITRAMPGLVKRFEAELSAGPTLPRGSAGGATEVAAESVSPRVALRLIHCPGVLERIDDPRQLFLLERQLRQRALSDHFARAEASLRSPSSVVIVDRRDGREDVALRKTA